MSDTITPSPHTKTRTTTRTAKTPKRPSLWHVLILDDDDHTYEYVMEMLICLFGHTAEKAFSIAEQIDSEGRAVCATMHLELAELRKEQVTGYGADPRLDASAGPMTARLIPAERDDEDEA